MIEFLAAAEVVYQVDCGVSMVEMIEMVGELLEMVTELEEYGDRIGQAG